MSTWDLFGTLSPAPAPDAGKQGTVLLVDDDQAILEMVGDRLAQEGYLVLRAASAEKALLLLQRTTPHVIILDIAMPGLGGLGFLRRLAHEARHVSCPVIIFTGRNGMADFFKDLPVFAFLSKPASPDLLLRTVRDAARRHPTNGAANPNPGSARCLLLVDDDELRRYHLGICFRRHGFEVQGHDGGGTLLEDASRYQPTVILIKYILPRHNGPALAEQLQNHPPTQHIPVILYDDTAMFATPPALSNVRLLVPSGRDDSLIKAVHQLTGAA